MICSAQTLRMLKPVHPFVEKTTFKGLTYGLSAAGYDIRVAEEIIIENNGFILASSVELFNMPLNVLGIVHDKSTWARKGLFVQNTVIEPGWKGYLTLEITNQGYEFIHICKDSPIAQVIFHFLDLATDTPYTGKYQHQASGPQGPRYERGDESYAPHTR